MGELVADLGAVHEGGGGAARGHSRQARDWRAGISQTVVCRATVTCHHEYLQQAAEAFSCARILHADFV